MGLPRVVVVGGGFAGLAAAKRLAGAPVRLTLIDRRNHHLFQPLLYQVATAALSPGDIAEPIRRILRESANTEVLLGEVVGIEPGRKVVLWRAADESGDGIGGVRELPYEFLVVATGATHSWFGHPEWSAAAPGLKTLEDALELRRRILYAFEAAEREENLEERRALLTFVVVGAGATGVEMAGAIAEIARHALARDFRRIDPASARVVVVEAGDRVLAGWDPELSASAEAQLRRIGVEVRTASRVTAVDSDGVALGEERLGAKTVIWAAGVAASPLAAATGGRCDRAGRVAVGPDLTVPGHPDLWAIGDLAALEQDGRPVFGAAPAAMQAGRYAADAILARLAGRVPPPFRYRDKGSMATIGRGAAVAKVAGLRLSGLPAWLAWVLVHIAFLIGFRNRLVVLFEWAWSFATFDRGARLVTGAGSRDHR